MLPQVHRNQLFVVLNIPKRLASADLLSEHLQRLGCCTNKRERVYGSTKVFHRVDGVDDVYAVLHYKEDPNKRHVSGKRVHEPVNVTKLVRFKVHLGLFWVYFPP